MDDYPHTCKECGGQGYSQDRYHAPNGWIITRRADGMFHLECLCPYCAQQRSAMRLNNVGNGMRSSSTGESSSDIKSCISCLGYLVGGFIISVILIILF